MICATTFSKNNEYMFNESEHVYYYKGEKVNTSVTSFIKKYFKEFDTDKISKAYAKKHGLIQEDVMADWKKKGDISALSGTIIHNFLENSNRCKIVSNNYEESIKVGLFDEVKERVDILMPKAQNFFNSTKGKLIPLALEYTVGFYSFLAGNIDMLAWNNKHNEIQIWDYKNVKEMALSNRYQKCLGVFSNYDDCNFIHYSIQLSFYKAMSKLLLGIDIGKMYLVHFNYTELNDKFNVHQVIDFSEVCKKELELLLNE